MGASRSTSGGGRVRQLAAARKRESEPPRSGTIRGEPGPPSDETVISEVIGANLRRLRARRGLSLERFSRLSGVSRAMLSQVELGKSVPSINVVWKVARALKVPFSSLIGPDAQKRGHVIRAEDARRLVNSAGTFVARALSSIEGPRRTEFYEVTLAGRCTEHADPHSLGTRENLVVASGCLHLAVGEKCYQLGPGDAITFDADQPHSYANSSDIDCRVFLVMMYEAELG